MSRKSKIFRALNLSLFLLSFILFSANTIRLSLLLAPVDTYHLSVKPRNPSDLAVTRQQISEQNENESGKELGEKFACNLISIYFIPVTEKAINIPQNLLLSKRAVNVPALYLMVRNFRI
jgi:hypothetical protein